MSSIDKTIISNLESDIESINFGVPEFNKLFKSLNTETKKKILKYPHKEVRVSILEGMLDTELEDIYNKQPEKMKKEIDAVGLRDKYKILRKLLEEKKEKKEKTPSPTKPSNYSPHSPDYSPPPIPSPHSPDYSPPPPIPSPHSPKGTPSDYNLAPPEEEQFIEPPKNIRDTPQKQFDNLVRDFYSFNPYYNVMTNYELEVKFGTKGIKSLTRTDYDKVIKKLKSLGFETLNNTGQDYLSIRTKFLDSITGVFKLSDIKTEIYGIHNIQDYCKNDDLKSIYYKTPTSIKFVNKRFATKTGDKKGSIRIYPVDFNDFNFRVTCNSEEDIKVGIRNFMLENWKSSKKTYRYINRVSFVHPDFPVVVDISIVKYSDKGVDKYGRQGKGEMTAVYTIKESNVFNNDEVYEIEIEVDNKKIGPSTEFNSSPKIIDPLRKVIKYILGGLQGTNFPISYPEQSEVLKSYMKIIWKDNYDPKEYINNKYFIGPNSITLQISNITQINDNAILPNIREDFVVTDKADGERNLMFISDKGKIYLINTNMDVIFTGAKTNNQECFNSILDGELIVHDKNRTFLNLYAAFDIYYFNKIDVRDQTFMLMKKEKDINKSRYYLLRNLVSKLNPVSIMDTGISKIKSSKNLTEQLKNQESIISPIIISTKEFFPSSSDQNIFNGCNEILQKEENNRFQYNTDGLIFTHAFYGVGSNEIGKAGPKTKITWEYSFKWKPPEYNTIDFLITTEKTPTGEDVTKSYFEDGISTQSLIQYTEYKIIELRCGFSEKKDGFINSCQDIIEDKLPQFDQRFEERKDNDYIPKRFYPTDPYSPNAGICKIKLKLDDNNVRQMFTEENEVFTDNMIIEFRYDFELEEGWRWVPLRVRYDKTSRYLRGDKEYGNSYKTANENWKSIHPTGRITKDMLCTGLNIPDIYVSEDIYYNTPSGKFKTEAMKNFHNLYVKKKLIKDISKPGDTLIDYACGKAGDLPKWIASKLSFVFGIDISKDNLENRIDGACTRFLKAKKVNKNMPYALFVNGNSCYNIKNGDAMLNDKAKQITAAIFGHGPKEAEKIGKGVARQYSKHDDGFNISSCQFAFHYFLESPDTLQGFMRNLAECTKLNGYFIGTAYDGKLVFDLLKKIKKGESVQINEDGRKIWEIVRGYDSDNFDDNSSCIGYRIDVYQESINKLFTEYLINFDYIDRVMESYGFKLITREEANELGFPEGSGLFSELFLHMLDEISKNKYKAKDYGNAANMSKYEQKISFLNRYFIYKKFTEVNVNKIVLELEEFEESRLINSSQNKPVEVVIEQVKGLKPKVRKLSKKLLLVPATEAVDDVPVVVVEKEIEKSKKVKDKKEKETKEKKEKKTKEKKTKQIKKLLVIENGDDDDDDD
jgi:hypothetical protein